MITLFLATALAAADAPSWLKEFATIELPKYPEKVPAAVLVNEETVTLDGSGKQTRTRRFAVKVLNRDGAREAAQAEYYNTDNGKVRDIKAWLIMPSGKVKEYGNKDAAEIADGGGLRTEMKVRFISAKDEADPGSVFGFESTVEEKTVFTQFVHDFQDDLPAIRSALVLNLPAGWKATGKVFRGAGTESLEPEISGTTYRWQLNKLPPFEREPGAPRMTTLNPRLVVSTFPPAGAGGGHFESWKDVATWKQQFTEPSAKLTPELEAKAKDLTANAKTFWDKLAAIAGHAQGVRYEHIQLKLSSGGGYVPRPAAAVLATGWGDCKDKANYMRTLLKAVGIDAYMVTIFSGDPRRVRQDWASPMQFNHAIIAIKVPEEVQAPGVFQFPALGRMLLFDPTDPYVPLGFVPDHEQDAWALMGAGAQGDLFKTPATPPSANRLERRYTMTLDAEGALKATLRQTATGQEAFDSRAQLKAKSQDGYVKSVEQRFNRAITGAAFSKIEPKDEAEKGFTLAVDFSASGYAKSMRGKLLMVKPVPLPYGGVPSLADPKRTQPLLIDPVSYKERVELNVPEGFVIDELPDSGRIKTAFGAYSIQFKQEGQRVVMDRELELQSAWVPVEQFKEARAFFGSVGGSEQSPVVLLKK